MSPCPFRCTLRTFSLTERLTMFWFTMHFHPLPRFAYASVQFIFPEQFRSPVDGFSNEHESPTSASHARGAVIDA